MLGYRPTGPHHVGIRDLEYCTAPAGSELSPETHLAGRLFYPCKRNISPPILWINSWNSASGYACFPLVHFKGWKVALAKTALKGLVWLLGVNTWILGYWGADILEPHDGDSLDSTASSKGQAPAEGSGTLRKRAAKQSSSSTTTTTTSATHSPAATSSTAPSHTTSTENNVDELFSNGQILPVLIVSHGMGGQRNTYSNLCMDMASRGFVVLAIEHADGTAGVARLASSSLRWKLPSKPAGSGRWRWFQGLGEREQWGEFTRYRSREVVIAVRLLEQLNQGVLPDGLSITGRGRPEQWLAGRLDMQRLALVGHSYGGATTALAVSEHPGFACGVALDPWWEALPDNSSCLKGSWPCPAPLLVIGSHDWNIPHPVTGVLKCNGERQEALLQAAAGNPGAGAVLMVPRHSTHHSFDDVLLNFGGLIEGLMARMFSDTSSKLSPKRAHQINLTAISHFLHHHMPPAARGHQQQGGKPQQTPRTPGGLPLTQADVDSLNNLLGSELEQLRLAVVA